MTRIVVLAISIAIAISGCSSEPTELVAGTDSTEVVEDVDVTEEADGDETSTTAPATTEAPATTSSSIPATTSAPDDDETTADETPTTLPAPGAVEILGDASFGVGQWGLFRPEFAEPDNECSPGELAFIVDGEVVHIYDDLAFGGGLRVFSSNSGQDAFVFNCEEGVERIAIAGSAVLSEEGWPSIEVVELSNVQFNFLSDFAWYGDVFGGFGSHVDGYDALFVNDPATLTMVPFDSLLGERTPHNSELGVSLLSPTGWAIDPDAAGLSVSSPTSNSRVQVWTVPGDVEEPVAEGDDLLVSETVDVRLWGGPNPDQPSVVGQASATEWIFGTPDGGARIVRHVPRCDEIVEIEMFADPSDSAVDQDLPWLTLNLVQVSDVSDGC